MKFSCIPLTFMYALIEMPLDCFIRSIPAFRTSANGKKSVQPLQLTIMKSLNLSCLSRFRISLAASFFLLLCAIGCGQKAPDGSAPVEKAQATNALEIGYVLHGLNDF